MSHFKRLKTGMGRNFVESTESIGDSIIPKKYRTNVQNYLRRADIAQVPYFTFGLFVYLFIILAFVCSGVFVFASGLFLNNAVGINALITLVLSVFLFILFFITSIFGYKFYVDVLIEIKTNKMEQIFPEFLSALALNLRTGGTLDNALENSTDKEFGVLSDEIKLIVRRIKLGGGVEEAILEFKAKYKSELIGDTFQLILLSWKKGGDTAKLVERVYENTKSSRFLNSKIIASVTNYRIFLTVLAIGITPVMFALTYHLIDLIRKITLELSSVPADSALPFSINAIRMNETGFIWFSVLSVIIISVCIAIIISIVKNGDARSAYKQIFFYAAASLLSYQCFMWVFQVFFSLFLI
jgi:Flp pilus assembly protein TadB